VPKKNILTLNFENISVNSSFSEEEKERNEQDFREKIKREERREEEGRQLEQVGSRDRSYRAKN
jgi:hypothetical protein